MNYRKTCLFALVSLTFASQGAEKIVEKVKKTPSCLWWVKPVSVATGVTVAGIGLYKLYRGITAAQLINRREQEELQLEQAQRDLIAGYNKKVTETVCSVSATIQKVTPLPPCLADTVDEYAQVGITWQDLQKNLLAEKLLVASWESDTIMGLGIIPLSKRMLPLTFEQKSGFKKDKEATQTKIKQKSAELKVLRQNHGMV